MAPCALPRYAHRVLKAKPGSWLPAGVWRTAGSSAPCWPRSVTSATQLPPVGASRAERQRFRQPASASEVALLFEVHPLVIQHMVGR